MNGSLHVLRLEVASDREAFTARIDEIEGLKLDAATVDQGILARAAVALHHAYGAYEAAVARVARVFDTEPTGANWHRALLETMAMEVPGIRPAIVDPLALADLRALLSFRHFFRHGYQVQLDPSRLAAVRDRAVRVRSLVVKSLERLDGWLQVLAEKA